MYYLTAVRILKGSFKLFMDVLAVSRFSKKKKKNKHKKDTNTEKKPKKKTKNIAERTIVNEMKMSSRLVRGPTSFLPKDITAE